MALLDKLKAGTRNVKQVAWPGTDDKVGIRVLTEAEIQQAAFATEKLFKKAGIDFHAGTSDAYQSEQNTQLLAIALQDDRGQPFADVDTLRPLLLPEVKSILIEELNAWQDECSPSLAAMTEEQYEELFEQVKKNPSISSSLSSRTRSGLITYLAVRPATLPKDSGSTLP